MLNFLFQTFESIEISVVEVVKFHFPERVRAIDRDWKTVGWLILFTMEIDLIGRLGSEADVEEAGIRTQDLSKAG